MRKTAALGAVAAAAGLVALPGSASAACFAVEEPFLYSEAVVCASTGQSGLTVAPSVDGGCVVLGAHCVIGPIGAGKTGYDGGVWVNGRPLAAD